LDFRCEVSVKILSLTCVPKTDVVVYSFFQRIFTNISTEMYSIFPHIVVTITPSSTYLKQYLVLRRRRFAPHSRPAGPMSNSIFSLVIRFSIYNLENIIFVAKKNTYLMTLVLERRFPTFRFHCIMFTIVFTSLLSKKSIL
jgi:hypothetical protein